MNTPKLPPQTDRSGCTAGADEECKHRHCATQCPKRAQIWQGVPDGWQLVPKEPTDAMVRAALHLDLSYMPGHDGPDRAAVYEAMLASAPPAPQAKQCEWTNCPTRVGDKCCNEQASVVQQKPQPLAWFDSNGRLHGNVSSEQLEQLCREGIAQMQKPPTTSERRNEQTDGS